MRTEVARKLAPAPGNVHPPHGPKRTRPLGTGLHVPYSAVYSPLVLPRFLFRHQPLPVSEIHLLRHTDSFSAVWPDLATETGAELREFDSVAELPAAPQPLALLLAAAGRESSAEPIVRDLVGVNRKPLVIGAAADHRVALSLVRSGALGYYALPDDLDLLRAELRRRLDRSRAGDARRRLAQEQRTHYDFGHIVGSSVPLREALERAARIIPHDRATVLITGETGTGKELLARAIHYNGPRGAAPFVELNCAAIPAGLLESELFGHERGAFTDARTAKPGLFEAAHGGTLFLDEIGHLPYELQGKILRAIEEKRIRRLGAVVDREVDVRIIAATHVDLAQAVRSRDFREDLFYRLSIVPVHLPPLRERGDDVVLIAEHLLRSLARQYDLPEAEMGSQLRRALLRHTWPGNVRELRNAIERAILLGNGTPRPEDLFIANGGQRGHSGVLPFPAPLRQIEETAARAMVERLGGNKSAAADALGISRSRLYRLLDADDAL